MDQAWSDSWLLSGETLAEAEQWAKNHPDELTYIEDDFLEACRKQQAKSQGEREQRKNRANLLFRIIAIGIFVIIVAFIYNIIATRGSQDTISIALWIIGSLILGYLLGRYRAR